MICFYHNDMDGKCAGFWVWQNAAVDDGYNEVPVMIPIDYKDRFPMELIRFRERVYIVDYSIQPDEMRKLLEITDKVVWIDHHKTAIEKYADFEHQIPGVRVDGVAGCVLTYVWLHEMTDRGAGEVRPFHPDMLNNVPMMTLLVGDRDVWAWHYGEQTKNFYAGLQLEDTCPESPTWREALDSIQPFEEWGRLIERFKQVQRKELLDAFGFEVVFEGYRGLACNAGRTSSELFDSRPGYDLMIPFIFDGEKFTVSLYSTTVDVSEIAKKYGGGGHKKAAGFQCRRLPFAKPPVYVCDGCSQPYVRPGRKPQAGRLQFCPACGKGDRMSKRLSRERK